MELTMRGLWTLVHGMGFGALYMLACSGAIVELTRFTTSRAMPATPGAERFLKVYLIAMVVLAWSAVLTGTYVVYPLYRAVPPPGTVDLAGFPQRLLLASAATSGWHSLGMEWKEHVAWLVPIAITMAAFVAIRYARDLKRQPQLRYALYGFVATSLFAAGIAGFFGAMLDKNAPVDGGRTMQLVNGEQR